MAADKRHPGPHLAKEIQRRVAKLTEEGIDPRALRARRPADAGPPPSTAELEAALAELDALLERSPSPASAEMTRLEELAGLLATYADVAPPGDESEPRAGRQG